MNIRRFRALRDAGATYTEIAAEVGCDWRTVKKYLARRRRTRRRGRRRARAPNRGGSTPARYQLNFPPA